MGTQDDYDDEPDSDCIYCGEDFPDLDEQGFCYGCAEALEQTAA